MPTVPTNTKCAELGCNNKRSKLSTFCLEHGGKDRHDYNNTDDRKQFNSMYQTPFWRSTRISQLSKQPLCQSCLSRGVISQALHVDHLFPWRSVGSHAFRSNIFQSLCHECHSHKTALEGRGICRHYNGERVVDYSVTDYACVVAQHQHT